MGLRKRRFAGLAARDIVPMRDDTARFAYLMPPAVQESWTAPREEGNECTAKPGEGRLDLPGPLKRVRNLGQGSSEGFAALQRLGKGAQHLLGRADTG